MKRIYLSILISLSISVASFAQVVLFVNDNAVNADNTATMLSALDQTGYPYEVFDAEAEGRSPEFHELANYPLVIWYMSSDGVGNYFWKGDDTDNENVIMYLQNGGALWVIGTDFLYDRYSTPFLFEMGEFMYDYLGVAEYHAQSYADDGFLGVPQLDLMPDQNVTLLDPVRWVFETLWYVDAVVPANDAASVYNMGPESYVFSNYSAAIVTFNDNNTLSYFFDPALVDTDAHRIQMLQDGLDYFSIVLNTEELDANSFKLYPNPANDQVTMLLNNDFAGPIKLYQLNGQLVGQFETFRGQTLIHLDLSAYSPGIYLLKCGQITHKLVVR